MGGKSSSKSSQSTSAKTANTNQQGNTAPISIPTVDIKGGKYTTANVNLRLDQSKKYDIRNTVTDHGAIEGAAAAVNKSIELSSAALSYYDKINERSLKEVAEANEGVLSFAQSAIDQVKEANKTEDSQNYQSLIKWVVIGGGLVIVFKTVK